MNSDTKGQEGRRWTIYNVSKKFTVEKATASPIPLGSKVEVCPVSELERYRKALLSDKLTKDCECGGTRGEIRDYGGAKEWVPCACGSIFLDEEGKANG